MALRGSVILWEHPSNPTHQTYLVSHSDKKWSRSFPPITVLNVYTRTLGPDHNNAIEAYFDDILLPEMEDDAMRIAQLVYPPNPRQWRLSMEEEAINWFHTKISNPVLALFTTSPELLQTSHDKPIDLEVSHSETVDISYSVSLGQASNRRHLVIGEFKRCLITATQWQAGRLTGAQRNFSQELRGYAFKYSCPQILSFDGETLLMLQFRAAKVADIKDPNCPVDCWVIPRSNAGGTPLRYALYRFLVQGFRRCQGCMADPNLRLGGVTACRRYFFNGVPVWKIDGIETDRPWGCQRRLHQDSGAFYWADSAGNPLTDDNGNYIHSLRSPTLSVVLGLRDGGEEHGGRNNAAHAHRLDVPHEYDLATAKLLQRHQPVQPRAHRAARLSFVLNGASVAGNVAGGHLGDMQLVSFGMLLDAENMPNAQVQDGWRSCTYR